MRAFHYSIGEVQEQTLFRFRVPLLWTLRDGWIAARLEPSDESAPPSPQLCDQWLATSCPIHGHSVGLFFFLGFCDRYANAFPPDRSCHFQTAQLLIISFDIQLPTLAATRCFWVMDLRPETKYRVRSQQPDSVE